MNLIQQGKVDIEWGLGLARLWDGQHGRKLRRRKEAEKGEGRGGESVGSTRETTNHNWTGDRKHNDKGKYTHTLIVSFAIIDRSPLCLFGRDHVLGFASPRQGGFVSQPLEI